jgi:transposase
MAGKAIAAQVNTENLIAGRKPKRVEEKNREAGKVRQARAMRCLFFQTLLLEFAETGNPKKIARKAGMPISTAYNTLSALKKHGNLKTSALGKKKGTNVSAAKRENAARFTAVLNVIYASLGAEKEGAVRLADRVEKLRLQTGHSAARRQNARKVQTHQNRKNPRAKTSFDY